MNERKATILRNQATVLAMLGLTNADIGNEDLHGIPARVRVWRGQRKPGEWQDVTLHLSCGLGYLALIAIETFEWTEFSIVDHFHSVYKTFVAGDYGMEIDHPDRVPDEVLEQRREAEKQALRRAVTDFMGF